MTTPMLILLAVAAYGCMHSLLAARWVKSFAARLLGEPSRRGYRLAYNALAVIALLPILALPARDPGRLLYVFPWPWAGLALFGQGLALLGGIAALWHTDLLHFLGLRQILENPKPPSSQPSTTGAEARPPRLVVHGLYRRVRHPLYSFLLVFLWLTPVMTTSLLALDLGLSAYLVVGSAFEERRLVAEFGEAYREYQRRVPRLVPFVRARPD